jgi:superfamily II DNA helicase RecQ
MSNKKLKRQQGRLKAFQYIKSVAMILGCQICEERDYSCLDFHHINPKDKKADCRYMIRNKWSIGAIREELSKCACICSNDHRKIHNGKVKNNLTPINKNVLINIEKLVEGIGYNKIKEILG